MHRWAALAAAVVFAAGPALAEQPSRADLGPAVAQASGAQINAGTLGVYKPALPEKIRSEENPITETKVKLGRMLYYDKRMSIGHTVSCNTCHELKDYGIDPRDRNAVSRGHEDRLGARNSPTVYNAAGQFRQFWDGRKADVEAQATAPVLNPKEMAMPSSDYVIKTIKSIPGYVDLFKKAFPDEDEPITFENFGKAIGAFERGLTTPAPWDEYLKGDKDAITDKQKRGFNTFTSVGCMSCHMGTYVGGQMYQKAGLVKPWPNQEDQGRYEVTNEPADKMMFKVPILRNVMKTGPYFHDGSVEDIDKAIRMMAKHQLGRELSDEQVGLIKAWFRSLTGEIPEDYIEKPELPASGPNTPEPKG